jgi:hypothetical protein
VRRRAGKDLDLILEQFMARPRGPDYVHIFAVFRDQIIVGDKQVYSTPFFFSASKPSHRRGTGPSCLADYITLM